ncbi:MAG: ankyrin repeat domain-containing protein [Bacteroidetes bacterium]|nr:ankyrin repeat domain-containing protein [Bacteroidota bacterium]
MSYKGISIFSAGIFLILLIIPFKSFSQAYNKASASSIAASDTSDYLPEIFAAAKEYNLMIASSKGLISEIERLIKKGANINSYTEEGVTPLIFAVSNNKPEAVKTLLKHSPRLDEFTTRWETALMIAVKNNYNIIAEALLRAGAEVDFADNLGASPLHYAALYGYTEMADLLLYYDAATDAKRDDGFTALHTAIWAGYPDIADLLIQNNANMEARDNDGDTPFLLAASLGDTLIMELLSKFKVDIFTRNNYNHNALTLAIAYGQTNALNYLLKKSNRWNDAENSGYNPYKVAFKYGRKDIDEILKANNIPGRTKHSFDQAILSVNGRFTPHDYYSGFNLSFKEPYYNAGFTLGMDMKLWYTRILREESEENYFQYYDKGAMIYTGLFKEFKLTNGINRWNTVFTTSLSAAYTFGNKFRGTMIYPDNKLKIIPAMAFKWTKNPLSVFAGAEFINYPDYYKIGPIWFRVGLSYNYYFDNIRIRPKKIKWN